MMYFRNTANKINMERHINIKTIHIFLYNGNLDHLIYLEISRKPNLYSIKKSQNRISYPPYNFNSMCVYVNMNQI